MDNWMPKIGEWHDVIAEKIDDEQWGVKFFPDKQSRRTFMIENDVLGFPTEGRIIDDNNVELKSLAMAAVVNPNMPATFLLARNNAGGYYSLRNPPSN